MKAYIFLIFLIPAYVNALFNCDFQPKCLILEKYNYIMSNEQEVQQKCNEFNKAVKCLDDYGKECMGETFPTMRPAFLQAYGKLTKLCTDENYKKEYLQESENFGKFKDEYNKCVADFSSVTGKTTVAANLLNSADKVKELCCSLKSFQDCTENMCKDCSPNAARIFKEMVLSENVKVSTCPQELLNDCPKNSSSKISFNVMYLAILMMFYALVH